ncbi:GumC family protein [Azotosporobacter soli]|uniref:GumC family protein n=1 Tax=Azotosporobacter soli TaxID=3055040 RepID=UPI0031FEF870
MDSEQFELKDMLAILKRRRRVIYYSILLTVSIAILINMFSATLYESTVSLRVKYYRGPNENVITMAPDDLLRQQIFTYVEIIKSRTVVEAVIERYYRDRDVKPSYEEVVRTINTRLVNGTQILQLSVLAESPEMAQNMTNILLEEFIMRLTEIVRSEGKDARTFIGERMEESKRNLEKIEKTMIKYKKEHDVVAVSDQTKSLIDMQADLKKLALENSLNLEQAQAKLVSTKKQMAGPQAEFMADSQQIQLYRTRLAEQEVELVSLLKVFREEHPKVTATKAIITETRQKLNEEIAHVAKAEIPSSNPVFQNLLQTKLQAEADIAVANAKRNALEQTNSEQDKELKALPDKEQEMARLMRDYKVAEDAYNALAKRYEDARIDELTQPTNVQVVDRAGMPTRPARPRVILNLVVAMVMGLCGGVIWAFMLDYCCKTIDNPEDVQRHLGLRVIGSIPSQENKKESLWRRLLKKLTTKKTRRRQM